MSTVPSSELFNDMIVEIDNDEFDSFAFLNNSTLNRSTAANNHYESESMRDVSPEYIQIKDMNAPGNLDKDAVQNSFVLPAWLESCNAESEGINQLSENSLSQNMSSVIIKEEHQFLKNALMQLHHTWSFRHKKLENSIREVESKIGSQSPPSSLTSYESPCSSNSLSSASNEVQMIDSKGHDVARAALSRKEALAATRKNPSCSGLNDVCGLTVAKQFLYQAVVMPSKLPHLFQGLRKPWTKILLYGPPGTGKTLLAHAVAAEIDAEFYCVAASDLLSSWLGESEKLIKEMFSLRPGEKKIVLFIDEIDSLCRQRTSGEADHSRRLKTEIFIQMDAMAAEGVFFIGATNCPWDLDTAFLRRFQRKIYIQAPDKIGRLAMFSKYESMFESGAIIDWTPVVDQSEGFSGADVHHLAQYALMQPIRELTSQKFWSFTPDGRLQPTEETNPEAMECTLDEVPSYLVSARCVKISDFLEALQCSSSTMSSSDIKNFEDFTSQYGAVS